MIQRSIEKQVRNDFFSGKAILLLGARQVGKTTFSQTLLKDFGPERVLYLNGENPTDREKLDHKDLTTLKKWVNEYEIIFIDEAQKIPTVGQSIKLLVDHYKK